MSVDQTKKVTYTITTDPTFANESYGITAELDLEINRLYHEIKKPHKNKTIDKLKLLIEQYPQIPIFKNYLTVAYESLGLTKKANEVIEETIQKHPDYLFAKLNLGNRAFESGNLEKVTELLGKEMDIAVLYPDRTIFHISEVVNFNVLAVRYFGAIGNLDEAETRLAIVKGLAPDSEIAEIAEQSLFKLRMLKSLERKEEEAKTRITVLQNEIAELTNWDVKAPEFENQIIHELYNYSLDISENILNEILALPRKSVIADLELLLKDAINRNKYFNEIRFKETTHSFVIHAFFILKELEATESLPALLSFMEYDYEFIEYWLGNHKTETCWQCFFILGLHQTEKLEAFLKLPGIDTYSKAELSVALAQIAMHYPERRDEIVALYTSIFEHFLQSTVEDNVIDSELIGLMICDLIDAQLVELLPVIKRLFEYNYVAQGVCGSYSAVEESITNKKHKDKRALLPIFDLYKQFIQNWGIQEDDVDYEDKLNNLYHSSTMPIIAPEKIERNAPCPCGSGKKYKKCCGN
jgi:tetratricopeptide (TPR) repeat protein